MKIKHLLVHLLLLVCVFLSLPGELQSQTKEGKHPWWITIGAGPSLIGTHLSLNGGMIFTYQFDKTVLSARMAGITNINPTVQAIDPISTYYKFGDYGLLYGPIWQWDRSFISLGGGVGLVRATAETSLDPVTTTSISIPWEAQWIWRPTSYAALGVYVYGSLNFEKHLTGVLLCVQLGAW